MYEIFEQLLQRYGITAYKVSKETGVTQSTLSDWKRGRSTPKTENMKKLADYFGLEGEELRKYKKAAWFRQVLDKRTPPRALIGETGEEEE